MLTALQANLRTVYKRPWKAEVFQFAVEFTVSFNSVLKMEKEAMFCQL